MLASLTTNKLNPWSFQVETQYSGFVLIQVTQLEKQQQFSHQIMHEQSQDEECACSFGNQNIDFLSMFSEI